MMNALIMEFQQLVPGARKAILNVAPDIACPRTGYAMVTRIARMGQMRWNVNVVSFDRFIVVAKAVTWVSLFFYFGILWVDKNKYFFQVTENLMYHNFPNFWTDMSEQTVQTQIRLLLAITSASFGHIIPWLRKSSLSNF